MTVDLKAIIGDQNVTRWFEYKDGFEVHIRHFTRRKFLKLQEEFKDLGSDEKDFRAAQKMVTGWRGLTIRKVVGFCVIDKVDKEHLDDDIPFSREQLDILMVGIEDALGSDSLSGFVIMKATDYSGFKPEGWEKHLKNSGRGESSSSPHEEKPATDA